jgi:hypothetical protein
MKHLPKQVRVDIIDKKYSARANQLAQHQKVPGHPKAGLKPGYVSIVKPRPVFKSIYHNTPGTL